MPVHTSGVLQLPQWDWTFRLWASSLTLSSLSDSCPPIIQHVLYWSEAGLYHWSCRKGWAGTLGRSLDASRQRGRDSTAATTSTPTLLPGEEMSFQINYSSHAICLPGTAAPLSGDIISGDPPHSGSSSPWVPEGLHIFSQRNLVLHNINP